MHTPELAEERSIANVRNAVAEQRITNPVMVDGDYSYWNAMKNQYWPAFYVIDKSGRIAARAIGEMHVGQARAAELERAIEEQLAADALTSLQLLAVNTGTIQHPAQTPPLLTPQSAPLSTRKSGALSPCLRLRPRSFSRRPR